MPLHNWATVGMVFTTSASFSLYRIVVLPAASRPSIRMRISLEPNIRCHTLLTSMPMMLKCQLGPAIWHEDRLEMLQPNTHGTTSGAGMPLHAPCHVMPHKCREAFDPRTIQFVDFVGSVGYSLLRRACWVNVCGTFLGPMRKTPHAVPTAPQQRSSAAALQQQCQIRVTPPCMSKACSCTLRQLWEEETLHWHWSPPRLQRGCIGPKLPRSTKLEHPAIRPAH